MVGAFSDRSKTDCCRAGGRGVRGPHSTAAVAAGVAAAARAVSGVRGAARPCGATALLLCFPPPHGASAWRRQGVRAATLWVAEEAAAALSGSDGIAPASLCETRGCGPPSAAPRRNAACAPPPPPVRPVVPATPAKQVRPQGRRATTVCAAPSSPSPGGVGTATPPPPLCRGGLQLLESATLLVALVAAVCFIYLTFCRSIMAELAPAGPEGDHPRPRLAMRNTPSPPPPPASASGGGTAPVGGRGNLPLVRCSPLHQTTKTRVAAAVAAAAAAVAVARRRGRRRRGGEETFCRGGGGRSGRRRRRLLGRVAPPPSPPMGARCTPTHYHCRWL